MQIREWLNDNSAVATVLAVLLLVGALAVLITTNSGGRRKGSPKEQYFYNASSRELIKVDIHTLAPIANEGGEGESVRAIVYSCTDCSSDQQIAWLEKYTEKAKKKLEEYRQKRIDDGAPPGGMMGPEMLEMGLGKLVKKKDGKKWVRAESQSGRVIETGLRDVCPEGSKIKFCYPGN